MNLKWERSRKRNFVLYVFEIYNDSDEELKVVQQWCEETKCGKRIAFNEFHFISEEMATFLLRWA